MPREVIRSKYFCKQVMEESLNDFQETKTKCIGPKIIKKIKQKAKSKKRVKGQKDIRTLIQRKNELVAFTKDFNNVCTNSGIDIDSQELQLAIALSKSLQEQSQSEAESSQSNKTLTSQERTNHIRRTLQEYGFKVPETKIKPEANKRVKKYKKHYRLLSITEEERREKISDKYSQILFQYPDPEDFNETYCGSNKINEGLFYLCTNISYCLLKSNDIFHVSDILQEISVNKGSLLKDWSNIPGRPCSPELVKNLPISISDIDYTQAEINTILSGRLKDAQEIFNLKLVNVKRKIESELCNYQYEQQNKDFICNQLLIKHEEENLNVLNDNPVKEILENRTEHTEITMFPSPCKDRSLSPDLFGDDASSVIDNTITHDNSKIMSSKLPKTDITHILDLAEQTIINLTEPNYLVKAETSETTKRKSNDFMDLTECVPTFLQRSKINLKSQSKICESKVVHDDCMEITDCINPSSPKFNNDNVRTDRNIEIHIDLVKENESLIDEDKVTSLDLTQSSNSDDELPRVLIYRSQKSLSSDTLIVDYDDYGQFSNDEDVIELESENVDVKKINPISFTEQAQHISDNNDKSVLVKEANEKNSSSPLVINNVELTQSLENVHDKKINLVPCTKDTFCVSDHGKNKSVPIEEVNENNSSSPLEICDVDLTQSSENVYNEKNYSLSFTKINSLRIYDYSIAKEVNDSNSSNPLDINNIDLTSSCFEKVNIEKEHPVSYTKDKSKSKPVEEVIINNSNDPLEISNIDLTQSSDSSIDIHRSLGDHLNNLPGDYDKLGKIGDVSIDYDEICVDTQITNDCCPDEQFDDILLKYGTSSNNVMGLSKNSMENSKDNLASSCSNASEVFKLSDREFNYSLCKSNIENFKSGHISIKDDNFNLDDSNNDGSCTSKQSLNRSSTDSCLPSMSCKDKVNNIAKKTEKYIKLKDSFHSTPIKAIIKDDNIRVQTPTNSEYLIKVREVTPMQDYACMSSPERNKELEKYGLKPFKRKRAIQLLTHLYNQTHPIVEYCTVEPIPAKKLKIDTPQKNTKLLKKKCGSPTKSKAVQSINFGQGKENEICYEETKVLPDIRDIECDPDDWVFQKREKAKIHSCRVPLHIVFHNYVSCRHGLREAILRYEPVNIDIIHKDLVSYGYRYNPKDLLKFLDKKCITVKTADNNARNSRK